MNITQSSIGSRSLHPSPMTIIGISRTTNNFAINFLKFFNSFAKCDNFSGTNESKILWIKEQYNIFSKIIAQFDVNISDVSIFQNGGFPLKNGKNCFIFKIVKEKIRFQCDKIQKKSYYIFTLLRDNNICPNCNYCLAAFI